MKTKLIALVGLAAGTVAGIAEDLPAGALFEVDADQAEPLLTAGQAKLEAKPMAPVKKAKTVKARVLSLGVYGKPNELVELEEAVAKQAEKDGDVDTSKAAVAYATELAKAAE